MKPKLDERTGEHVDNVFAGTRTSYYIPFTKKNVDEIIANSAHTDKFGIRYVVKFGHEDSPESMTSIQQEINSPTTCSCGHGRNSMNGSTGLLMRWL